METLQEPPLRSHELNDARQPLIVATLLGYQDIKQAYRRSALGPFWLTIGMAIQIVSMGLVFGLIFKTELNDYLPFLAISIIFWGLISATLSEGCMTFVAAEPIIKQLKIHHFEHVARVVLKNVFTTAHNVVILPLVLLFFWKLPGWQLLSFIPGLLVLVVNLTWCVWLLGMVSARFRDLPPIISSVLTIAFYVTPVMWYPSLIENDELAHFLLGLNPLYHWMQIVRLPLLGEWPTVENWALAVLSAGVGWVTTIWVHRKYKNMIAYWV